MQTQQIRIRLTTDELNRLKTLAQSYDLNPTNLSLMFVKSGIRAVDENKGRLSLPLKFKVEDCKPK